MADTISVIDEVTNITSTVMDAAMDVMDDVAERGIDGAPLWLWIVLSLTACAAFWCQAIVTEERYVSYCPTARVYIFDLNYEMQCVILR